MYLIWLAILVNIVIVPQNRSFKYYATLLFCYIFVLFSFNRILIWRYLKEKYLHYWNSLPFEVLGGLIF